MKRSQLTQELVNVYPSWSRIRSDDQSIGQQFINALAIPMETMEKELARIRDNQYLTTANLDEIDITYRIALPVSFEFEFDDANPLNPCPVAPEVSGLISGVYHTVSIAEDNDIESFWYTSKPNRTSLADTASGIDDLLLSADAGTFPRSGLFEHHLRGGHLWVETTGGIQYLTIENDEVHRGQITLTGRTRKGTIESETLIFPWDLKQRTLKEWREITNIDVHNMESGVQVDIRSSDFNAPEYLDFWNLRFSDNRNKIDTFWALGEFETTHTIDRIGYITDEWQQLILGFSDKEAKESWELLDEDCNPVSGVDIAIQPFTDRAWVATASGLLYCYDTGDETISGIDLLKERTPGSSVRLDFDRRRYYVLGEDIVFQPIHIRADKEIIDYRIWYQTPSGVKFGLSDGSAVSFTSDFLVKGEQLKRTIANEITVSASERGEFLFVLEVTFIDGEEHTDRVIISVNSKKPEATLDLTSIVPEDIKGIEFDSDQKLWVKTISDRYYKINLHTDIMVIDFQNKIIYLKENYEEVDVTSNA